MSPNNRKQFIPLQELASGLIGEEVRTSTDVIVRERLGGRFLSEVLSRVGPEGVTHETGGGRFAEAVELCGDGKGALN